MKKSELEKLENVKVTFGRHAFSPKVMFCDNCDIRMKKASIVMPVSPDVNVKLNAFRCSKCHEETLGLDEAKKLDRALVVNRLLSKNQFKFKRKLSYDGNNYIFRLPRELTQGKKYKEVEISPLESDEALIKW